MKGTTTLTAESPSQTLAIGRFLGQCARPNAVMALVGPLGAGKTQLAKGIADGLEVSDPRRVNSPTFVIVNEYSGRLRMYHVDVYRLAEPGELATLGFEEMVVSGGVVVIEWADRVQGLLPEDHLWIGIQPLDEAKRAFTLSAKGAASRTLLDHLRTRVPEVRTSTRTLLDV